MTTGTSKAAETIYKPSVTYLGLLSSGTSRYWLLEACGAVSWTGMASSDNVSLAISLYESGVNRQV